MTIQRLPEDKDLDEYEVRIYEPHRDGWIRDDIKRFGEDMREMQKQHEVREDCMFIEREIKKRICIGNGVDPSEVLSDEARVCVECGDYADYVYRDRDKPHTVCDSCLEWERGSQRMPDYVDDDELIDFFNRGKTKRVVLCDEDMEGVRMVLREEFRVRDSDSMSMMLHKYVEKSDVERALRDYGCDLYIWTDRYQNVCISVLNPWRNGYRSV